MTREDPFSEWLYLAGLKIAYEVPLFLELQSQGSSQDAGFNGLLLAEALSTSIEVLDGRLRQWRHFILLENSYISLCSC